MIKVEQLDLETLSKMYVNLNSYTRNNIIEKLKKLNAIEVQKLGLDADFIYNELGFGSFVEEIINSKISLVNTRIDELIEMINNLDTKVSKEIANTNQQIQVIYNNLLNEIRKLSTRITQIETNVDVKLTQFGDQIIQLQNYIDSLDLEELISKIKNIDEVIIPGIQQNITNINKMLNDYNTRITNIENSQLLIVRQDSAPTENVNRTIWVDTSKTPNIVRFYVNNNWTGMNTYA